jgi:hypothetical protein
MRCNAAMVVTVCSVAGFARLQRPVRVVSPAVATPASTRAGYSAAIVFMDELPVLETHRVSDHRQVRDARELPRHRAQRQRTGQAAAG